MRQQLPIISSREALVTAIADALHKAGFAELRCEQVPDATQALDYLSVELPSLAILDCASPDIDALSLTREIAQDPWLLHGSIIAIYQDYAAGQAIQQLPGVNVVVGIDEKNLVRELPRVLRIIQDNRRLLYQRGLDSELIGNLSGQFSLPNDPVIARCYVNLICNFLFNAGRISLAQKTQVQLALTELFINAIEHGNCGISSAEKTAWMESGEMAATLIAQRNQDPEIASRCVHFEYQLDADEASFLIRDEGQGFDWRKMPTEPDVDSLLSLHGRGIFMSRQVTDRLEFNELGNEVRFSTRLDNSNPDWAPSVFGDTRMVNLQIGETVCVENDASDDLYYIVQGEFEVAVGGKTVAHLSSDDIFIGDMSFLLHSPRSGTVTVLKPAKLIAISRRDFALGIRKNPHYALFLARLLAQRLIRQNLMMAAAD